MTFFIFFLILLLVILWPVIKLGYKLHKAQARARKAYDEAFGYRRSQSGSDDYSHGAGRRDRSKARGNSTRRKVFTVEDGEYVEFEEIETDIKEASGPAPVGDFKPEQQVEDAEWEDIR